MRIGRIRIPAIVLVLATLLAASVVGCARTPAERSPLAYGETDFVVSLRARVPDLPDRLAVAPHVLEMGDRTAVLAGRILHEGMGYAARQFG